MIPSVFLIPILVLATFIIPLKCRQVQYTLSSSSNQEIRNVLERIQHDKFESILDPMLITRVPGTQGNAKVREYITKFMKDLDWTVELDSFTDNTPLGQVDFTNIIATLDPKANKRLVIACHFDSKLNRENTLVTATDSAVPCAMMMSLAADLKELLNKSKNSNSNTTLQLVFFDGEEAFVTWTKKDSIYGARHLAAQWQAKKIDGNNNYLSSIEAFVLLDLIGAPEPTFYNLFPETGVLHKRLVTIEKKLHGMGLLENHRLPNQYFRADIMAAGIEDDHIPFLERGVPILHLIAVPFPKVWHTENDDKQHLDFNVIRNINKIFYNFVVEYLHLLGDSSS